MTQYDIYKTKIWYLTDRTRIVGKTTNYDNLFPGSILLLDYILPSYFAKILTINPAVIIVSNGSKLSHGAIIAMEQNIVLLYSPEFVQKYKDRFLDIIIEYKNGFAYILVPKE